MEGSTAGLNPTLYSGSGHPKREHCRALLLRGTRQLGLLGAEMVYSRPSLLDLLSFLLDFYPLLLAVNSAISGCFWRKRCLGFLRPNWLGDFVYQHPVFSFPASVALRSLLPAQCVLYDRPLIESRSYISQPVNTMCTHGGLGSHVIIALKKPHVVSMNNVLKIPLLKYKELIFTVAGTNRNNSKYQISVYFLI